jgi:hypothetical protein
LACRLLNLNWIAHLCARLTAVGFVLFVALVSTTQDKPVEAWWLHASFSPTETAYESLPVSEINPNWIKIAILSYASLPPDAKEDLGWMHQEGFAFQVDDYFKQERLSDRELCGVFEDHKGRRGRFLLVLEKPNSGRWKVAFLHQEVGEPGFSVLARKPRGLFWAPCMQCDEFSRLRLKQGSFHLESSP